MSKNQLSIEDHTQSSLSFLDKLLEGVEVEWKSLGEMGEFQRGKRFVKTDMISEGIPCIHYGEMYTHYDIWANQSKSFLSEDLVEKSKLRVAKKDDVIIVAAGETIEDIGKGTAWLSEEKVVFHDACFSFRSPLNPRYVAFFSRTKKFHDQIRKHISSGKISAIGEKGLSKVIIPIPCPNNPEKSLKIQKEIVRILDSFTELTAELTAELIARKKQYEYYREALLSFEEGEVEWKTLGEVADFHRGTAITKKETTPGNIPVVANGPLPTYFHGEKNRDGEIIVIARSGAYAGYVSFWDQPIFLTDAFSIHPNHKILKPKYVYYFLQNKQQSIHEMKKGAGVPHVRVKEIELYEIPIPPLEEQARIVSILDKFDTLTTSISEGLPKEIELRQKQYEYYRELLLTFPKNNLME